MTAVGFDMRIIFDTLLMMKAKSPLKRARRGSDFRGFLKGQGILKEVEARALKQAVKLTNQTISPCSGGWSTGLS
jgi:hypothetical protein